MQPLDETDLKILRVLQQDGSLSVTEVAERVGLSQSPCSRRAQAVKRLVDTPPRVLSCSALPSPPDRPASQPLPSPGELAAIDGIILPSLTKFKK